MGIEKLVFGVICMFVFFFLYKIFLCFFLVIFVENVIWLIYVFWLFCRLIKIIFLVLICFGEIFFKSKFGLIFFLFCCINNVMIYEYLFLMDNFWFLLFWCLFLFDVFFLKVILLVNILLKGVLGILMLIEIVCLFFGFKWIELGYWM